MPRAPFPSNSMCRVRQARRAAAMSFEHSSAQGVHRGVYVDSRLPKERIRAFAGAPIPVDRVRRRRRVHAPVRGSRSGRPVEHSGADNRQLVLGVTERFGGFVGDFAGDGVVAYFGYPTARGNDAELAVRGPRNDPADRAGPSSRSAMAARAGCRRGSACTQGSSSSDASGSGRAKRRSGSRAAVEIAARLQNEAPPSGVVISRETRGAGRGPVRFRAPGGACAQGAVPADRSLPGQGRADGRAGQRVPDATRRPP